MEKVKVFRLITMTVTFLALVQVKKNNIVMSAPEPSLLCATQFSLANHACSLLPFVTGPPSLPARSDDEEHGHRNGHHHRHHHHHGQLSAQEESCCRWAQSVDNHCVCELLLHYRLPTFIVRPSHQYTLAIGKSCEVTYSCGGPI